MNGNYEKYNLDGNECVNPTEFITVKTEELDPDGIQAINLFEIPPVKTEDDNSDDIKLASSGGLIEVKTEEEHNYEGDEAVSSVESMAVKSEELANESDGDSVKTECIWKSLSDSNLLGNLDENVDFPSNTEDIPENGRELDDYFSSDGLTSSNRGNEMKDFNLRTIHTEEIIEDVKPLETTEERTESDQKSFPKSRVKFFLGKAEKFKCEHCRFETLIRSTFSRHMKEQHNKIFMFKCKDCDYKTSVPSNLTKHLYNEHTERLICDNCGFKAKSKSSFSTHKCLDPTTLGLRCAKCDFITNDRSLFICKDAQGKSEFECRYCDFKSSKSSDIQIHKASNKTRLKLHVRKVHEKMKKFQSDYETSLENHNDTVHLKVNEHRCVECNVKTSLTRHVCNNSSKGTKYKCGHCDYESHIISRIKCHTETVHCEEKKYKCDVCDFKSNYFGSLINHMNNIHCESKRFKCDQCDYKTNRRYELRDHSNSVHHGIWRFRCKLCGYQTNHSNRFKLHVEKIHEILNKLRTL